MYYELIISTVEGFFNSPSTSATVVRAALKYAYNYCYCKLLLLWVCGLFITKKNIITAELLRHIKQ